MMATDPATRQLYPLSTSDAASIPLDVASPLGLLHFAAAANSATQIVIPEEYSLVMIHATIAVVLDFTDIETYPISGAKIFGSALYVPEDTIMTMWLPSTGLAKIIPVVADTAGSVFIQGIQKWAALGLKRQLGVR